MDKVVFKNKDYSEKTRAELLYDVACQAESFLHDYATTHSILPEEGPVTVIAGGLARDVYMGLSPRDADIYIKLSEVSNEWIKEIVNSVQARLSNRCTYGVKALKCTGKPYEGDYVINGLKEVWKIQILAPILIELDLIFMSSDYPRPVDEVWRDFNCSLSMVWFDPESDSIEDIKYSVDFYWSVSRKINIFNVKKTARQRYIDKMREKFKDFHHVTLMELEIADHLRAPSVKFSPEIEQEEPEDPFPVVLLMSNQRSALQVQDSSKKWYRFFIDGAKDYRWITSWLKEVADTVEKDPQCDCEMVHIETVKKGGLWNIYPRCDVFYEEGEEDLAEELPDNYTGFQNAFGLGKPICFHLNKDAFKRFVKK